MDNRLAGGKCPGFALNVANETIACFSAKERGDNF